MTSPTGTLHQHYEKALREHGFTPDPAQLNAIAALEKTYAGLLERNPKAGWQTLIQAWRRNSARQPVAGVYLWGGVGRGKTFVMDVFFDALPFERKHRYHFHRLMYRVHGRLKTLKGETDPLEIIAAELAEQAQVICFDEFFVTEIGDAMLLGKLLQGLFNRGVSLVATSNIHPDKLYSGGLQRQQFLPAIALLHEHTNVLQVDGGNDYRLRVLEQAEIWHDPLDDAADSNLKNYFTAIAPAAGTSGTAIEILGRDIVTRKRADGIAWFDFSELCDGPRSKDDYIELARAFQTVLVSAVPRFDHELENQARRFIALVDEFYERRVKLICSAAEPILQTYAGTQLTREFERTGSRLLEMQSKDYLAAPHIP